MAITLLFYVTGTFTFINAVEYTLPSLNRQDISSNILMDDDPSKPRSYGPDLLDDTFDCCSMCTISRKQCVLSVTDCAKHGLLSTKQLSDDICHNKEHYNFPVYCHQKELSVGSSNYNNSMFHLYDFGVCHCPSTTIGHFQSFVVNTTTVSTGLFATTAIPSDTRPVEAENDDLLQYAASGLMNRVDSVERVMRSERFEAETDSENRIEGTLHGIYSYGCFTSPTFENLIVHHPLVPLSRIQPNWNPILIQRIEWKVYIYIYVLYHIYPSVLIRHCMHFGRFSHPISKSVSKPFAIVNDQYIQNYLHGALPLR